MAIKKTWFKYFDEKRETEQIHLEEDLGRKLSKKEKIDLLPKEHTKYRHLDISLILFSKESDGLIAKYINDSDESERSWILGVPYLFKLSIDLKYKSDHYRKCYRLLINKNYSYSTGIMVGCKNVHLTWRFFQHDYETSRNKGFQYYASWEDILKGEKEVFEIISKKESVVVNRLITVEYREGWEAIEFTESTGEKAETTYEIMFVVKEKIFLTQFARWFSKMEKTYSVTAIGGPVISSGLGQDQEAFSYAMGGEYLIPIGKVQNPKKAIDYYVEELKNRI